MTPQQIRIVTLLAQGTSISEAAALENIHRNTITNWRRAIPAFATELDHALQEQRQYWQDQAARLAPQAIEAIEDCLTNPNSSPSLRFRAATYILKMATAKTPQVHNHAQPEEVASFNPPESAPSPSEESASFNPRESAQSAAELASFVPRESAKSAATKPQPIRVDSKPGRNDQCPCNSGQKYKRCCISKAA